MAPAPKRSKKSQGPRPRPKPSSRPPLWVVLAAAAGIVAVVVGIVALSTRGGGTPSASAGLPDTPDYHSLLVDPKNPDVIFLGTHVGIDRSADGGRRWQAFKLEKPRRDESRPSGGRANGVDGRP
jgi:hypothetical protein